MKSTIETPPFIRPKGFPEIPKTWESSFEITPDGTFCALFLKQSSIGAKTAPKVMLVVHGHGEYLGRYLHFPALLDGSLDGVVLFDLRGHGRSEGMRGDIRSFSQYAEQIDLVADFAKQRIKTMMGKSPTWILYGHSMGGLVVLEHLRAHFNPQDESSPLAYKFKAVILSAPALAVKAPVPVAKKAAAQVLKHIWGGLQLGTGLEASLVSRDPEVIKSYQDDLLVHDKMTPRLYGAMTGAMYDVLHQKFKNTQSYPPLLILVPLADGIIDPKTTLSFAEKLLNKDREVVQLEGGFHEPHNDIDRGKVFEIMGRWLDRH